VRKITQPRALILAGIFNNKCLKRRANKGVSGIDLSHKTLLWIRQISLLRMRAKAVTKAHADVR
jgi:hypothetical protein